MRIWHAIRETVTHRIADAILDPLRRRNVVSRILEGWLGGVTAATIVLRVTQVHQTGMGWTILLGALAAPLVEFLVYEFLLEPLGWSGHYWERGPRDGEVFTRP